MRGAVIFLGWLALIALTSATACGEHSARAPDASTPVPVPVPVEDAASGLSITHAFTPNAATISTSEGAPYSDCDFWVANAAGCLHASKFGYGPTRVVRIYICLSGEVSTSDCSAQPAVTEPLSADMLAAMDSRIAAFAGTGVRLIVRFTYNFGPIGPGAMDAPVAVIAAHLDQVAPILLAHQDLVFALEAGFIGTWGEWHDSTNGNDSSAAHATVLDKELHYFGGIFPILVRDPGQLIDYLGGTTPVATFGLHDDFYDSSATDGASWIPCPKTNGYCLSDMTAATLQAYAAAVSATAMFAGEFGAVDAPLQSCAALDAVSYMYHLQSISLALAVSVGAELQGEGCATSFLNKVGSRLEVVAATVSGTPAPGGQLAVDVTLVNAGYGRILRARPATLVVRAAGQIVASAALPLTTLDLRTLAAAAAPTSQTFALAIDLPTTLPTTGAFSIALQIPDPAPSLTTQPAYALPLNSLDGSGAAIFDPATGDNTLATFTLP